ncbi:invasion associated locus B family protein [Paracoccus pacificus]|uniref:Invasion associated locus B family protein n=1 Tax=Paracoccus pacificus TaxID=1463598 RepID=A0ABW4R3Q4_9RHOB
MNKLTLLGAGALFAALPLVAAAQVSTNVVAVEGDWSVFAGDNPKECWAVSQPTQTVNTRDGKPTEVQRGDIRLYVAYRPGSGAEVSFGGGYPFAADSAVEANVGGQTFKMFTEGENAWTGSAAEDAKLLSAMRAGSTMVLTGRSSRGTVTKDTFSLKGITAASKRAESQCK